MQHDIDNTTTKVQTIPINFKDPKNWLTFEEE